MNELTTAVLSIVLMFFSLAFDRQILGDAEPPPPGRKVPDRARRAGFGPGVRNDFEAFGWALIGIRAKRYSYTE